MNFMAIIFIGSVGYLDKGNKVKKIQNHVIMT
jgi:hypothetical protein